MQTIDRETYDPTEYSLISRNYLNTKDCEAPIKGTAIMQIIGIIRLYVLLGFSFFESCEIVPVIRIQTPTKETISTTESNIPKPFFKKRKDSTTVRRGPKFDTKAT